MPNTDSIRRSPLDAEHEAAGGKMVAFAGWRLPVRYKGVIDEHRAVRSAAGLFDVSHMGEVAVAGADAQAFLQFATPNDVGALEVGEAHYSSLLTDRGTYVDDLLVYRLQDDDFFLVVNAANTAKDLEHLMDLASREFGDSDLEVRDVSNSFALLAVQGPEALGILASLCDAKALESLGYYRFFRGEVAGRKALVSRTGYTGEDGFELYLDPQHAGALWRSILEAGRGAGLVPAGLGARDTLRTEAGMALYGHEIDDETNPYEARLGWTIKLDKGEFCGRPALVAAQAEGPSRKLVGFEITGRGIAREGCAVWEDGRPVGSVTSGTFSPTLDKAIGMAYVSSDSVKLGREMEIEVRGRRLSAVQVRLPFYKRKTA
ncbi:MAG: glycine cleavage system aminomethyltransferase GcvT [Thermoanaerobaculia bacterium]